MKIEKIEEQKIRFIGEMTTEEYKAIAFHAHSTGLSTVDYMTKILMAHIESLSNEQ